MSTEKPQIEKESEVDVLTQVEREHEIILFNDDVNTFDHVIKTLVTVCDHTYEQAERQSDFNMNPGFINSIEVQELHCFSARAILLKNRSVATE